MNEALCGAWTGDRQHYRRSVVTQAKMEQNTMGVDDIVSHHGASAMTAYRDYVACEQRGVVRRHRGPVNAAASAKKEMVNFAKMSVLMVHHMKFNRRALHGFISMEDFDIMIVYYRIDSEVYNVRHEYDIEVPIVQRGIKAEITNRKSYFSAAGRSSARCSATDIGTSHYRFGFSSTITYRARHGECISSIR